MAVNVIVGDIVYEGVCVHVFIILVNVGVADTIGESVLVGVTVCVEVTVTVNVGVLVNVGVPVNVGEFVPVFVKVIV